MVALTPAVCNTTATVVGTEYHWGIKPLTVGMHSADLIREPNNEYDTNAIAVHIEGNMTGYLSRDQAERYAPALDVTGVTVQTMAVCESNGDGLSVKVYLPTPGDVDGAIRTCWPS